MRPRLAALAAVAALAAAMVPAHASSTAGPTLPAKDPFYSYAGAKPLRTIAPGTVLKTRTIDVAFGPQSTQVSGAQLLYRTTGERGEPTVTVTTVLEPPTAAVVPNIVGYLSFYDGLDSKCDPSYTIAGGDAGSDTNNQAMEEEMLMLFYLAQGWIVTVPDFEGTDLHWMAGRESGYGTLDGVRATESYLELPAATKVGLSGYSGGALAGDWAAEVAPSYAPKVNLVGVAMGGVPVNYSHMFRYINGTGTNSAVMPGMLLGLARAYDVDLSRYLSPYGAKLVKRESTVCITEVFGDYPGLTYQKLMKPQYRNIFKVPAIANMLRNNTMGSVNGHPKTAFLMGNGNSDGKGDGVMRADDVKALADEYCRQGNPVVYQEYQGADHVAAGAFYDPATGPFLQTAFAGLPFPGACAT